MPNINATVEIINAAIKLNDNGVKVPLFLWGRHGVGKTSIVYQAAKKNGMDCVVLNLANQTPEDLLGQIDGKGGYHRPAWMKDTKKRTVYFLDEINRAPKYVLQSTFNFINEGRIHTHTIKPGDIVIAAGNPDDVDYDVTSFDDAAFVSRFSHIVVEPTKDEFNAYLNKTVKNSIIQTALEQSGVLYNTEKPNLSFTIKPNNRNLERVARIFDVMSETEIEGVGIHMIRGLVGMDATAIIYDAWRNTKTVTFEEIRKKKVYPFKKTEVDKLNRINTSLYKFIGELDLDNISAADQKDITRYLKFVPKDMRVAIIQTVGSTITKGRFDFIADDYLAECLETLEVGK